MKQQAAQVYFPQTLYIQIKMAAKKDNKAMAAWLRDLAEKEISKRNKKKKTFRDWPTFDWDVDPNLSEKIDDVVYGDI